MTAELAGNALRNALALRGEVEAIVQSDRGSQFRSHSYCCELREAQLRGTGRKPGPTVHDDLVLRDCQTREQLRLAIVIWIEQTYHRRRRQDNLGRLTPIEYETMIQTAHAA